MDDRYACLALGYLRGINQQLVNSRLLSGSSPAEVLQLFLEPDSDYFNAEIARDFDALKDRINKSIALMERHSVGIISLGHESYPGALTEIQDAPSFLYYQGSIEKASLPQIAIVGSRSPTRSGLRHTYDMAAELARGGFAVTSGLALGIDAAAHRGAIDGNGYTLAVMGTGLDQIYPERNRPLATQIMESGGALISEFPPGTPPRPENFPRRNRIVSGLSCVVVVVEAQARSGSLITARLGAEQGRMVCAVPGGAQDPLKAGCHHLIREGAILVRDANDIAEAATSLLARYHAEVESEAKAPLKQQSSHPLVSTMGADPHRFETLLEMSGLSAAELSCLLGELEIAGEIYRSAQGYRRA